MRFHILLILLNLLSYQSIFACSCFGEDTLCKELNDTTDVGVHPIFLIQGIKLSDTLHGIKCLVQVNLVNETTIDTIIIWGDDGDDCRNYFNNHLVGDTIIIGLIKIDSLNQGWINPNESIGDYFSPSCGVTKLDVKNRKVIGSISDDINEMDIQEFQEYILSGLYSLECNSTNTKKLLENNILIYPNPCKNILEIETGYEIVEFHVYDLAGKEITGIILERAKLNLQNISDGIYIIKLILNDKKTYVSKIVKTS